MTGATFHDPVNHQLARDAAANLAFPDERHGIGTGRSFATTVPVRITGTPSVPDMSWNDGTGLCAGANPDLWFPENSSAATGTTAKAICRQCPLLEPCREHGIRHERFGIWGGMSERDRRLARRERNVVTSSISPPVRRRQRTPIEHGTTAGAQRHRRDPDHYGALASCEPCRRAAAAETAARKRRARERRLRLVDDEETA